MFLLLEHFLQFTDGLAVKGSRMSVGDLSVVTMKSSVDSVGEIKGSMYIQFHITKKVVADQQAQHSGTVGQQACTS